MIRNAALAATMALVMLAAPVNAQAPAPAPTLAQQLRPLMEVYAVSTFALGADQSCQVLQVGELSALTLIKQRLTEQIGNVVGAETLPKIDMTAKGESEAKDCAISNDAQELLDTGHVVARALMDAPTAMQSDPSKCLVDGELKAVTKSEWSWVEKSHWTTYENPQLQATYDGLRGNFANIIDQDCTRKFAPVRVSNLLQPAFTKLLHLEDLNFYKKDPYKTTSFTRFARDLRSEPVSHKIGAWSSRLGGFTGTRGRAGLDFFRVVADGDVRTAFATLASPGTFGVKGTVFFSRDGRWSVDLGRNVAGVQIALEPGIRLDMTKLEGSGSGMGSHSKFVLAPEDQMIVDMEAKSTDATLYYSEDGKSWKPFLAGGKDPDPQKINLGELREGLAWASAPRPKHK